MVGGATAGHDRGRTTRSALRSPRHGSYTLAQLVPPVRTKWSPEPVNPRQQVVPGSIALLDTDGYAVEYVHDGWLADVHGDDLDLTALLTAAC
ncbi:hypothetical protein ACU61A_32765 [Pseudonocardia sichuanensis]